MSKRAADGHSRMYEDLWQDVVDAHYLWMVYGELFMSGSAPIALMNGSPAREFLGRAQRQLFDHVILSLCRLCDPAKRRSLTLETLLVAVQSDPNDALHGTSIGMWCQLLRARLALLPIRRHRNKRIAHKDARVAAGKQALPSIPPEMVDECLAFIADFMRTYSVGHHGPDVSFDVSSGTVPGLLLALERAVFLEERERMDHDLGRDFREWRRSRG